MIASKDIQIFVLDNEQKQEIKDMLYDSIDDHHICESELEFMIAEGMDSRLSDLEEFINIDDLETITIGNL